MLEQAILKTIVYYDCLDYPLALDELKNFLFGGEQEFHNDLRNLINKNLVEESGGFYFLKGRKNLINIREERSVLAVKKWQKALKAARWLCLVPYIRMVFASGSLALSNTDKDSDLDVLLVAKHGRIWTTRFLTIVLLSLLGVRRTRYEKIAPDKICLNHFITDKSFHIPRKSIYTAQLYARLIPIFGEEKLIAQFCEANKWVGEYVEGWPECVSMNNRSMNNSIELFHRRANSKFSGFIKKTGEKILDTKFGGWLENILKKYQLRRINNFHLTHKPGGRIKADDESLEFHPDSPELRIIEKYNKKMKELGFLELANEKDSGLTK